MESPLRSAVPDGTRLIETFGWWPGHGVTHADLHRARMARGALALGYVFDPDAAQAAMDVTGDVPLRCRLTLGADGRFDLTTAPLPPTPDRWRVGIAGERLRAADPWLGVKSTHRGVYDRARAALPAGLDEWLFLNERDEVCEGTITNLFVQLTDGRRVTPPLACGVLPGILRQTLLADGWAEAVLTLDDLARARRVWMGNALRGLIAAEIGFS
jgi:4-amino-4-deoxychorismate lyase